MERVIVTNPMVGIFGMQVCAIEDATDEEILKVCNSENVSGTSNGWCRVIREIRDDWDTNALPVRCADYPDRVHFIVTC